MLFSHHPPVSRHTHILYEMACVRVTWLMDCACFVYCSLKEFLPKEYAKLKVIERKIFKVQYRSKCIKDSIFLYIYNTCTVRFGRY